MTDRTEKKVLLQDAIKAAIAGGVEILDVYENHFEVEYKDDKSPLTEADKRAHKAIVAILDETGVPVLSEEGKQLPFEERSKWHNLWVVDPLDGTKEFIKQNGEFTVNIAFVEGQTPTLGVIYVPVSDELYFGGDEIGTYKLEKASKADFEIIDDVFEQSDKLPKKEERPYTMVGSRSHMSDETLEYFTNVRAKHPDAEIISKGSSLKICMVAEGAADVYPRFAPTMEWDTAAGHAIAKGAGFEINNPKTSKPLVYNKEDLLNPWFIVEPKH